jgi:hypothetical protein
MVTFAKAQAFPTGDLSPVKCSYGTGGKFTSAAQYRIFKLHETVEEYKYFDRNCNGILEESELAAFHAYIKAKVIDGADAEYRRYRDNSVTIPVPQQNVSAKPTAGGWSSQFVLRDSFDNISIFSGLSKDVSLASGATFSYARDNVISNTVWSAKGVAAYPISWSMPPITGRQPANVPYLIGFAVTPAVSFQRVSNSTPSIAKKMDVNILTFGAGGEVAVGNLIDDTVTHYFRTRGAAVTNFDGQLRSWQTVSEYEPITNWSDVPNIGSPNPLGTLPATYQLDAILRTTYAQKANDGVTDPLFNSGPDVFRLGPVLGLTIMPLQGDDSPVPKWLQKASLAATYSWLDDFRHGQTYNHFTAALAYALDNAGHIGMKISYEKGKIEETAQNVNMTRVGLTAKY